MADVILTDGDSSLNQSSEFSNLSADLQLSRYLLSLTDDFIRGLREIRALLTVAQNGLYACPKATQQNYLKQIDKIAEGAVLSFMEIVELYRDRDQD